MADRVSGSPRSQTPLTQGQQPPRTGSTAETGQQQPQPVGAPGAQQVPPPLTSSSSASASEGEWTEQRSKKKHVKGPPQGSSVPAPLGKRQASPHGSKVGSSTFGKKTKSEAIDETIKTFIADVTRLMKWNNRPNTAAKDQVIAVCRVLNDCGAGGYKEALSALFSGTTEHELGELKEGMATAVKLANQHLEKRSAEILDAWAISQLFTGVRGLLQLKPFKEATTAKAFDSTAMGANKASHSEKNFEEDLKKLVTNLLEVLGAKQGKETVGWVDGRNYATILLSLMRIRQADVTLLRPHQRTLDAFLKLLAESTRWRARDIVSSLASLGGLLVGNPPVLAATEQAKSAAGKLISLMSESLEDENSSEYWTAFNHSQALLGLQRLSEAEAIDLDPESGKNQVEAVTLLLDRLAKSSGDLTTTDGDLRWDAHGIANALGALGDLLVGDSPALAATEQAKSAAVKLISVMEASLNDKKISRRWGALGCSQALLGLQRLCKAKAINLGLHKTAVKPLLDRLATNPGGIKSADADQGWGAQQIATAQSALGDLLGGDPPALTVTAQAKSAAGNLISLMSASLKDKSHGRTGKRSGTPKRCSACSGCAMPTRSIWIQRRARSKSVRSCCCSIVLHRIPAVSKVATRSMAGALERLPMP